MKAKKVKGLSQVNRDTTKLSLLHPARHSLFAMEVRHKAPVKDSVPYLDVWKFAINYWAWDKLWDSGTWMPKKKKKRKLIITEFSLFEDLRGVKHKHNTNVHSLAFD